MKLLTFLKIILITISGNILYASQEPFISLLNADYQNSIIMCPAWYGLYRDPCIYKSEDIRGYSEDRLIAFVQNGIDSIQKYIKQENRRVFIFPNCSTNEKQGMGRRRILVYQKTKPQKNSSSPMPAMTTQTIYYNQVKQLVNNSSLIIYNIPSRDDRSYDERHIDYIDKMLSKLKAPILLVIDPDLLERYTTIKEKVCNRFINSKKAVCWCNPYSQNPQKIQLYQSSDEDQTSYERDFCTIMNGIYILAAGILLLNYYPNPNPNSLNS